MVQILLVLVTMVGFGIQKHIKNIFGVSQNDSKMFSQRFWDIKDKMIFWWKKNFFKIFRVHKKFENRLMVQILLVLVTMVGFGIQKHIKNIFGVSQNDSKMFSQRFWDIKDKIIFWWKKFFFKNFSSPKKIQNSQDLHKITKKCQSRQLWAVLERQIIIFWACKSSYRVQEVKLDLRLATCVLKRNTLSWK